MTSVVSARIGRNLCEYLDAVAGDNRSQYIEKLVAEDAVRNSRMEGPYGANLELMLLLAEAKLKTLLSPEEADAQALLLDLFMILLEIAWTAKTAIAAGEG